jgi:protein gp37
MLTEVTEWLKDYEHRTLPRNIWLGTSVEDQAAADLRIRHLLRCPAAVRWLSVEPMIGPVDLRKRAATGLAGFGNTALWASPIGWVVCGGESGPGARPMHPDWARSLRDQCQAAGVPFFFKQWGEGPRRRALRPSQPGAVLQGDQGVGNGGEPWIALP